MSELSCARAVETSREAQTTDNEWAPMTNKVIRISLRHPKQKDCVFHLDAGALALVCLCMRLLSELGRSPDCAMCLRAENFKTR